VADLATGAAGAAKLANGIIPKWVWFWAAVVLGWIRTMCRFSANARYGFSDGINGIYRIDLADRVDPVKELAAGSWQCNFNHRGHGGHGE
jgi:hypothetical protein